MSEQPRYPHHCGDCLYLGQSGEADLYYCRASHHVEGYPSVVIRKPCRSGFRCDDSRLDSLASAMCPGPARCDLCSRLCDALFLAGQRGLIDKCDVDCILSGVEP